MKVFDDQIGVYNKNFFVPMISFPIFCRQNDYEHFLCSLLIEKNLRAAAIVLRAYNIEIAKVLFFNDVKLFSFK